MTSAGFDPLVPRPIDRPTVLALSGDPDPGVVDVAKILAAPDDPAEWARWRDQLERWRTSARQRHGAATDGRDGDTEWAARCFSTAIVWLWDERLFDHGRQVFTPERWLQAAADHGGFDAIVLWHAYPIIGLDERNQFDFYRDVSGLAELIAQLRGNGVRVLLDYNPWDVGTRRAVHDDATMLTGLVTELGADGVFLDTMREGGRDLVAALRRLRPQPVLEGESRVPLARIGDHEMSWAQWFADSPVPGVLAAHWFERRHQQHHTRRWNRDHSDELQSSWMNGTGIVVWDSVFGSWVGWNSRDRSTLRRILLVQRMLADVFVEGTWTPLVDTTPTAIAADVYTSRFSDGSTTVWTAVNRGHDAFAGPLLDVTAPFDACFDLTTGSRLDDPAAAVEVPARGIGGVLAVNGEMTAGIGDLLAALAAEPCLTDAAFPERRAARVPPVSSTAPAPPSEVVQVEAGSYEVEISFRVRETGLYDGAPFVEEWKPLPPRLHAETTQRRTVRIGGVAVACLEVLAPDGSPLTGLTLAEARDVASEHGARLPTEFEWQLAAADPAFRRAQPLVWNWTESEHSDGITRFAILKGGCAHDAAGSEWYFDGGPRPPEFSAKLLLAGLDVARSTNIGFRLAWDRGDSS